MVCGPDFTIVRTATGRLFAWGTLPSSLLLGRDDDGPATHVQQPTPVLTRDSWAHVDVKRLPTAPDTARPPARFMIVLVSDRRRLSLLGPGFARFPRSVRLSCPALVVAHAVIVLSLHTSRFFRSNDYVADGFMDSWIHGLIDGLIDGLMD